MRLKVNAGENIRFLGGRRLVVVQQRAPPAKTADPSRL